MADAPAPEIPTTPYDIEYRYNIQWMIDTYGLENLSMDDLLVQIVMLKATSLFYMDNGDPGQSELIRDYMDQLINLYNENSNPMEHSTESIIGGLSLSKGAE